MKVELRYSHHPEDFKSYDTARIRKEFLVEHIFIPGEICLTYSMYDRFIVGGAMPVEAPLMLETFDALEGTGISSPQGNGNYQCGWRGRNYGWRCNVPFGF